MYPEPPANLDWNSIGIAIREVNGHVESKYNSRTGQWSDPKIVKGRMLEVDGLSPGLNYGQQVYEGMKAFRTPQSTIQIFRPEAHATRMAHSCSYVSIPEIPSAHFIRCVSLAVSSNSKFVPPHDTNAALYIRPLAFGSGPQLNLILPEEYTFCVFVLPVTALHGVKAIDALVLEEFDRAAPRGTGSAKVGGNYAPVFKWAQAAKAEGFEITLHLDSKTRSDIEEFSAAGFLGLKKDSGSFTLVAPNSESVIKSVTSESCLDLANSWGWNVEVRPIKIEELPSFDEVLAVGTGAVLVPIRSISIRSSSDKFEYPHDENKPQPGFARLFHALPGIQRGLLPDEFGWCKTVDAPEAYSDVFVDGLATKNVYASSL